MNINSSRYTLPYAGCPLLTAMKRIYPPHLMVNVISDGSERRVPLQELELLVFPIIVDVECSAVYNFYQCLMKWKPLDKPELIGEEENELVEIIRTFLQKRVAQGRDVPLEPVPLISTYHQLIKILKVCPEVHRIGFLPGLGLILGIGTSRALLVALTEKEIRCWSPYHLDLDDGFYDSNDNDNDPVLLWLNQSFQKWRKSGYQGEFLAPNNN